MTILKLENKKMSNVVDIKVKRIVNALELAGESEVVFFALNHVPTKNLKEMKSMIESILKHRHEHKCHI